MQFLVYLTGLMISVSTVLLEVHWLTTAPPQPKATIGTAAAPTAGKAWKAECVKVWSTQTQAGMDTAPRQSSSNDASAGSAPEKVAPAQGPGCVKRQCDAPTEFIG